MSSCQLNARSFQFFSHLVCTFDKLQLSIYVPHANENYFSIRSNAFCNCGLVPTQIISFCPWTIFLPIFHQQHASTVGIAVMKMRPMAGAIWLCVIVNRLNLRRDKCHISMEINKMKWRYHFDHRHRNRLSVHSSLINLCLWTSTTTKTQF